MTTEKSTEKSGGGVRIEQIKGNLIVNASTGIEKRQDLVLINASEIDIRGLASSQCIRVVIPPVGLLRFHNTHPLALAQGGQGSQSTTIGIGSGSFIHS